MRKLRGLYQKIFPKRFREAFAALRFSFWQSCWYPPTLVRTLGEADLREMARRLRSLKDQYRGQRCFIMGNGPSLNRMDLSLLAGEHVWASNRAYLLFDRISWRPDFYIAVDRRVVPDNAEELNRLAEALPATRFFYPSHYRLANILQARPNVYWYYETWQDPRRLLDGMFSLDAARQVRSVSTVSIAALQLAVYFGFDPIYLIGCDTSYTIPANVKFEDEDKKMIVSQANDDPNHFTPAYFGAGKKWHDPNVKAMIFHYEQAERALRPLGTRVYNATAGGNLEVFERVEFESLFPPRGSTQERG